MLSAVGRLAAIIVSLGLVAAACAGSEDTGEPVPAPGDAPIEDALAFSATTVDGTTFDAGELAGQDVLLWFWAPW